MLCHISGVSSFGGRIVNFRFSISITFILRDFLEHAVIENFAIIAKITVIFTLKRVNIIVIDYRPIINNVDY